eukprot:Pgem_evm1s6461
MTSRKVYHVILIDFKCKSDSDQNNDKKITHNYLGTMGADNNEFGVCFCSTTIDLFVAYLKNTTKKEPDFRPALFVLKNKD